MGKKKRKKHIDKLIIKDLENLFAKDVLELLKLEKIKIKKRTKT